MKVTSLPAKEDPDTLILKEGAEAFKALLDASQPLIDWQVAILLKREGNESDAALDRVTKKVLETISFVPSAAQKERMVNRCAELLKVSPEAIMSDLHKVPSRPKPREQKPRAPKVQTSVPTARPTSKPPPTTIADLDNRYEEEVEYDPFGGLGPGPSAAAVGQPQTTGPATVSSIPPEELHLLELLVQHPETRPLCQSYIKTEHLRFPAAVTMHGKLAEEATEVDLIMTDLVEKEPETAKLLARLQINSRSLGTDNLSPIGAMQQTILVLRRKDMERQISRIDDRIMSAAADEQRPLHMKAAELSMLIQKLKEITRHNDWDKAIPILELE